MDTNAAQMDTNEEVGKFIKFIKLANLPLVCNEGLMVMSLQLALELNNTLMRKHLVNRAFVPQVRNIGKKHILNG
ncbi:MAG: hypothetical protein ABIJ16_09025, partial [Bacteroidota bacterium]